jgi:hypothetical protein
VAKVAAAAGFVVAPEMWAAILAGLVIVDGLVDTIRNDDPEKELLRKKQLIARAAQMGLELKEKQRP